MDDATWLSDTEWEHAQRQLPIVCVDVLPVRAEGAPEVGLILRQTPHQGLAWCLVGGRLRMGEGVADAARRELRSALGVQNAGPVGRPDLVVEYQRRAVGPGPHDPRKHAIGLTFVVPLRVVTTAQGEAQDFRWYDVHNLPDMGFGQEAVIADLTDLVLERTVADH